LGCSLGAVAEAIDDVLPSGLRVAAAPTGGRSLDHGRRTRVDQLKAFDNPKRHHSARSDVSPIDLENDVGATSYSHTSNSSDEPLGAQMARVWHRFLTERDRAYFTLAGPPPPVGFGDVPALILIDNSIAALGEQRLPFLEGIKSYPLSMGLEGWNAVDLLKELLDLCRDQGMLIVHTTMLTGPNVARDYYSATRLRPDYRTQRAPSAMNMNGAGSIWDIVQPLEPLEDEILIRKPAPSAFHGTSLSAILRLFAVDTLLVTGNSTSGCVRATVIDSASEMLRTIVVEECCFDRSEASHAVNLFDMDQKYADVLGLAEVSNWVRTNGPFVYQNEVRDSDTFGFQRVRRTARR
jgi:nicotinamidase-related amidase